MFDCGYMALCEVYNVNIIPHTSAVRCFIVIAPDTYFLKLSDRNKLGIWQEICRNSIWILTDLPAFVGANRVKIAKGSDLHRIISLGQILQNLLDHKLGLAIRIGYAYTYL